MATGASSSQITASNFPFAELPVTSSTYFIYRTQLSILSHEIVTKLYCAATIQDKWSEVQGTLHRIDQRLKAWQNNLPSEFYIDMDNWGDPDWNSPYTLPQIGLTMLYNSSRMILFRPCLCRFEGRLKDQTEKSKDFSQESVETCVRAARNIITLLSCSASPVDKVYTIPPWWNTLHYLCEALSVLTLELAFQSQHMPREAAFILDDAKKGVRWLSMMSAQSISARKAWEIFDRLIRHVAPLVNWSVYDMPTEAPIPPGYSWQRSHPAYQTSSPQVNQNQLQSLSEAHLQNFQNTQSQLSTPAATTNWMAQPPAFHNFAGYQQGYPSESAQFSNPLDQTEALSLFSSIGHLHGHYDDPWLHMFVQGSDGAEDMAMANADMNQQSTGRVEDQVAFRPVYHEFENLGGSLGGDFGTGGGQTRPY